MYAGRRCDGDAAIPTQQLDARGLNTAKACAFISFRSKLPTQRGPLQ